MGLERDDHGHPKYSNSSIATVSDNSLETKARIRIYKNKEVQGGILFTMYGNLCQTISMEWKWFQWPRLGKIYIGGMSCGDVDKFEEDMIEERDDNGQPCHIDKQKRFI